LDIDVEIKSPRGKSLYLEKRRQRDKLPLEVSVGIFQFCFSNEFSSLTHKIVHFSISPQDVDTRALAREVDKAAIRPGVNTLTEQTMETIHASITRVSQYGIGSLHSVAAEGGGRGRAADLGGTLQGGCILGTKLEFWRLRCKVLA